MKNLVLQLMLRFAGKQTFKWSITFMNTDQEDVGDGDIGRNDDEPVCPAVRRQDQSDGWVTLTAARDANLK